MTPTTLVTGGTGFLGKRLVARLLAEGKSVRVLARRPDADLNAQGVDIVSADLSDGARVRAACSGIETVFHVGARVGVWGPYEEFFHTNVEGTRAIIEGCKKHGVRRLIYTSTPSVVYNGGDLSGVDESAPLTTHCPSPYPLTKAIAEREVLAANCASLRTIALRPHLIWGPGDPHLVPRLIARARAGRLRIIGNGKNLADLVHIENAVDAQLLAEHALTTEVIGPPRASDHSMAAAGRAFFITNGEPVVLWDWLNKLLEALGERTVTKSLSFKQANVLASVAETVWKAFRRSGEPPLTRFVVAELAHNHWFNITAARRDLGYTPRVSMAEGLRALVAERTPSSILPR